jgi:uncharacterized repeat protein (TIGR03847 family)
MNGENLKGAIVAESSRSIGLMSQHHEFGRLSTIACDTLGEPGQRRFRMQVVSDTGDSATIWIEKTQLAALGDAIRSILSDEKVSLAPQRPDDMDAYVPIPLNTNEELDIRAGQLSLGLDQEQQVMVVVCSESELDEDDQRLTAQFDFGRARTFRVAIEELVSSGRPTCPLCTAPMDPEGHVCPKSNGHHKQD